MTSNQKNCDIAPTSSLPRLKLPPFDIRLRPGATSKAFDVFDSIRRKWVALTPEEWVRQHFVNFLIEYRGYSPLLIANEVSLKLNDTRRRADTVIYDHALRPRVIVEYKAPTSPLRARLPSRLCATTLSSMHRQSL